MPKKPKDPYIERTSLYLHARELARMRQILTPKGISLSHWVRLKIREFLGLPLMKGALHAPVKKKKRGGRPPKGPDMSVLKDQESSYGLPEEIEVDIDEE